MTDFFPYSLLSKISENNKLFDEDLFDSELQSTRKTILADIGIPLRPVPVG